MIDFPIIIDDLINESFYDTIEQCLFKSAWALTNHCTFGEKIFKNYGLDNKSNHFLDLEKYSFISPALTTDLLNKKINLNFDLFDKLLNTITNEINFDISEIKRIMSVIHIPNKYKEDVDGIHINSIKPPDLSIIYYINDSCGDTILYDSFFGDFSNTNHLPPYEEWSKIKIFKKISPKKNRCVIFEGKRYHTSTSPKNNLRCIINFDINGHFNNKIMNYC